MIDPGHFPSIGIPYQFPRRGPARGRSGPICCRYNIGRSASQPPEARHHWHVPPRERQAPPRYLGEFDLRWNTRKERDGERAVDVLKAAPGKRLTYKDVVA
jgi:hypothetical protein